MKICKNCQNYHKYLIGETPTCKRKEAEQPDIINYVTGQIWKQPNLTCQKMRLNENLCGHKARYFILKEKK